MTTVPPALALKPRIHSISLSVDDLERAVAFYRDGLDLPTEGIIGTQYQGDEHQPAGRWAMFTLDDGLVLSLYPRSDLAKDANLPLDAVRGSGVSIGQFVATREEVDNVLELAARAGGEVLAPARERPWGQYSGYFRDLDGYLWEVMHFLPDGDGDPQ